MFTVREWVVHVVEPVSVSGDDGVFIRPALHYVILYTTFACKVCMLGSPRIS